MPGLALHVNAPSHGELPRALVKAAVKAALRVEGVEEGEISVTFVGDREIRELNARYLSRDRVTDVIAFSLNGPEEPPLGDVYVGLEQARRQAEDAGVPLSEELARLAVHGVLHVLGHDHPETGDREASEHFRRQEAIVREVMEEEG